MYKLLCRLHTQFISYMKVLPIIGYNSSKYDINTCKGLLLSQLGLTSDKDTRKQGFVIKKNNAYSCISTEKFRWLDLINFMSPNMSYSAFLKAYGITQKKGFFPYTFLDHISKLDFPHLPPYEAFYSDLKSANVLDMEHIAWQKNPTTSEPLTGAQEYTNLQKLWSDLGMTSLADLLCYYNNLDTKPMVEGILEMQRFYKERDLDVFKIAISIPGLARTMLMRTAQEENASFALFASKDQDLHHTVKANLVGGPSIIFNRHHKANETFIRGGKICKSVCGYDSNSMYLRALSKVSIYYFLFINCKAICRFIYLKIYSYSM